MTKAISKYFAKIGSRGGKKGGKVRASKLSEVERHELAQRLADKRWQDGRCRRREKRIRCKLAADGHGPEKCRFD